MLASLAAVRASQLQIAALEKSVRQGREARDRAGFQRSDEVFHRTIAEAAGNRILLALFTAVMECRSKEGGNLGQRILTNERREIYNAHHAACLAAIRDRHAGRAGAAMRQHLELVASACDVFGAAAHAQAA
jgi:DNA-binding FadR family transcriptional regulator